MQSVKSCHPILVMKQTIKKIIIATIELLFFKDKIYMDSMNAYQILKAQIQFSDC